MKKVLMVATVLLGFGCGDSNTTTTRQTTQDMATDESVEIGAGDEISPQLEGDDDSARLRVDTVTSSQEVQTQQQPIAPQ
ncbi:hypothetical protein GU926_02465 [Nibribacter ruber]|uniref:Uncharacterized protein n=1 Tax=Nibribacter ruber TaxID=2698458 RepID=A0A6P1NX25_9BACT|nr:hypothetical protein [Nibribacter ruber]QHL86365.1 hypothetical protein GU926_02465 [Nibribacter ruber]